MDDILEFTKDIDESISDDDEDQESFTSCISDITTDFRSEEPFCCHIELIFHPERGGFIDVAENIVQYLDYHSFISFKRSSQKIYNFFKQLPYLEYQKLGKKLDDDWRSGEPKNYAIQTPGLVSCATVFPDNRRIVIGIDHVIHVVDIRTGNKKLIYNHYS